VLEIRLQHQWLPLQLQWLLQWLRLLLLPLQRQWHMLLLSLLL
jgi:hypothetical protein